MSIILSIIFVLTLVGIDQIIKYFVIEYLKPVGVVEFIEGFIRFRYVENTGAVFGSFSTHTALLTVISIILLGVTVYFLVSQKNKSRLVTFTLLLMIAGGIGNIIDIFYSYLLLKNPLLGDSSDSSSSSSSATGVWFGSSSLSDAKKSR